MTICSFFGFYEFILYLLSLVWFHFIIPWSAGYIAGPAGYSTQGHPLVQLPELPLQDASGLWCWNNCAGELQASAHIPKDVPAWGRGEHCEDQECWGLSRVSCCLSQLLCTVFSWKAVRRNWMRAGIFMKTHALTVRPGTVSFGIGQTVQVSHSVNSHLIPSYFFFLIRILCNQKYRYQFGFKIFI